MCRNHHPNVSAPNIYDVVIVGAGPAGCMAAILLSESFNVLIVERHKLPRPKSCSGVLIQKAVRLIQEHVGPIPLDVQCTPRNTTGLSVITSSETFDFEDNGLNIHRADFDHWLAKEAQKRGVDILEQASVLEVQRAAPTTINVSSEDTIREFETKMLIFCDGINGCARRLLGIEKQRKVITYQKFYNGTIDLDYSKFYAYTSPEFSQFDAWINIKDGRIVIGVIAEKKSEALRYHQIFIDHLARKRGLKIAEEVGEEAWCLPLVVPQPAIVLYKGNAFLAGEAAGLLNPFGEGISLALSSAIALAESCITHRQDLLQHQTIAEEYRNRLRPELEYMQRQWDFTMRIAPEFQKNTSRIGG